MSQVLLTAEGPEHRFVAKSLAKVLPELTIFVEKRRAPGRRSIRRWMKRGPMCVFDKTLRILYRRVTKDAGKRQRVLAARLEDDGQFPRVNGGVRFVDSVNDQSIVSHLESSDPRLVVVYGTGLVRAPVLEAAGCSVLNLHTGLSPWYRGVACYLWPLVDRRGDRIGVTVHDCVPELDAGGILKTGCIEVELGDSVHDVFAKQVLVGAPLLAECSALELQGRQPRQQQDLSQGREYRGVELGIRAELSARRGLKELQRRQAAG